ncbi:MAG TPA: hypothetical protein VFK05_34255 [Polyangiaceae bacterium]|nr:hypothetical protein [Polyangiaceae bacterium]
MTPSELAHLARRPRARRAAALRERVQAAQVTVTCTPGSHDGAPQLAPAPFELVSELGTNSNWTRAGDFESHWVEALSACRCREVVLTARLGDDLTAKQRVFELAEFLTFRLSQSQPLIRVLFLPAPSPRAAARNHA